MELIFVLSSLLLWVSNINGQYHRSYSPGAPLGHDGRVIDTPEVAQAKAAHLATFTKLASRPLSAVSSQHYQSSHVAVPTTHYGPVGAYSNPGSFSSRIQHGPYGYRGPFAPLAHDGQVLDTPEVAEAKAAHLAAFNQAASRSSYNAPTSYNSASAEDYSGYQVNSYAGDDDSGSGSAEGYQQYQGGPAPLAENGLVVDTPEVARAKAAHLAAFQKAVQGRYQQQPNARERRGYYDDY